MERHEPESTADLAAQLEALRTSLREERAKSARLGGELADAREQQTATSEILRVISQSQADAQPVFDAIVGAAVRLLHGDGGALTRVLGTEIHMASFTSGDPHADELLRRAFPIPLDAPSVHAIALRSRAPFISADIDADHRLAEETRHRLRTRGWHSGATVLLMLQGEPVGTLSVTRRERGGFNDDDVALLKTFADQAVIAIENVRLFTELQEKNRVITEALERQTATSEILRIIASSPTDVQPVFETIVQSAQRLFESHSAAVVLRIGDEIHLGAYTGTGEAADAEARSFFPLSISTPAVAHVFIDGKTEQISDVESDPRLLEGSRAFARRRGWRSRVVVPMHRDGTVRGAIAVTRREPGPFSNEQIAVLKTFADQAVIAIENVRLFTELQEKNRALTQAHAQVSEALEQQTATSQILGVISQSLTDIQPALDAVAASAARLCEAFDAAIWRRDGDRVLLAAHHGPMPEEPIGKFTLPLVGSFVGRSVLDGRTIHSRDVQAEVDKFPATSEHARRIGFRAVLCVPLMREGVAIGSIALRRMEAELFTDRQVALLQTFAAQAVIAIENVRLFTELGARNRDLTMALDQQTATSEILKVISGSPTDIQPVFDTIARNASRLCGGMWTVVTRYDGELLYLVADENPRVDPAEHKRHFPLPASRRILAARPILERTIIHIPDVTSDPDLNQEAMATFGIKATIGVPMMHDDRAIGSIGISKDVAAPFTDAQIALLKTFADQAVIAIENVRLFKELQEKNRALTEAHAQVTEALEQQTATSEILRTIARAQTDVRPVFDTIARRAVSLCRGYFCAVFRFDGERLHLVAHHNFPPDALAEYQRRFPMAPHADYTTGRAILTRSVVHVPDFHQAPEFPVGQQLRRTLGSRAGVAVPMLRDGKPIGVINVGRAEPEAFTETEIDLLKTFADQAVIAIENARLFNELEGRTEELTRSVGELRALGEVGQAVSSTLDLETVLTTIVSRAVQLSGTDGGSIYEYDDGAEEFILRATHNLGDEYVAQRREIRLRKGEGVSGRMALTREPVEVPDITAPGAYDSRLREVLLRSGARAVLAVPLLREDCLIGGLVVNRNTPGEFPSGVVELLKTFATQSALAIQNARLFQELADKSRELEAASQHKSEFLANMSHELRTPLNAILGFSEVLAQGMFGPVNEKQTEYLRDILESGRHLLSLINDILDLSKIEAGRMELELSEFDLPQAIGNALTLVRERALRRGIALRHVIDPQLAGILADERKIKQVLLNLLSNAIKFTPEGGRIEVRAAPTDGLVAVAVTDTGIGISPEDLEAVFEEFRQVGTADKKAEGTGLGLSLAKKFIELHGGRIWVESEVGRGSTFTFTLPVARD